MKREKIIQLLLDSSVKNGAAFEEKSIPDYNYDALADAILSLSHADKEEDKPGIDIEAMRKHFKETPLEQLQAEWEEVVKMFPSEQTEPVEEYICSENANCAFNKDGKCTQEHGICEWKSIKPPSPKDEVIEGMSTSDIIEILDSHSKWSEEHGHHIIYDIQFSRIAKIIHTHLQPSSKRYTCLHCKEAIGEGSIPKRYCPECGNEWDVEPHRKEMMVALKAGVFFNKKSKEAGFDDFNHFLDCGKWETFEETILDWVKEFYNQKQIDDEGCLWKYTKWLIENRGNPVVWDNVYYDDAILAADRLLEQYDKIKHEL